MTPIEIRHRAKYHQDNGVWRLESATVRGRDGEVDVEIRETKMSGRRLKGLIGGGEEVAYDSLSDGYYYVSNDGDTYNLEVRDGVYRRVSPGLVKDALGLSRRT